MADPALKRLRQIAKPSSPDDTLSGAAISSIEANATDLKDFFDGILSQIKRMLHGPDVGNWHDDVETIFAPSEASIKAILSGMGAITPDQIRDDDGAYTVPSACAVGHVVYITGDYTADRASNASYTTGPVTGIVVAKPTATTATVAYAGKIKNLSGLTPATEMFLGVDGAIIAASAGLPTASNSIVQRVGITVSTTELIFLPGTVTRN